MQEVINIKKRRNQIISPEFDGIKYVVQAIGRDEYRDVLMHVFKSENKIVCTDGRRLHSFKSDFFKDYEDGLYRVVKNSAKEVFLYLNKEPCGKYPEYQSVIPKDYNAYKKISLKKSQAFFDINYAMVIRSLNFQNTLNLRYFKDVCLLATECFVSNIEHKAVIFTGSNGDVESVLMVMMAEV